MPTSPNVVALRAEPVARRKSPLERLSPDDMLLFAQVARGGGVRAGAQALRVPRSTVSRRLSAMEEVLGGRLVARTTRRFAITELGQALLAKCGELEELLRSTAEVTERVAREPSGLLRVAASPIVGEEFLPEVVEAYLRRFPKVRLAVELSVDFVDIAGGAADIAIRNGPLAERGDLYATRLAGSLKGLFATRGYLDRAGTPEAPEELSQHECIVVGDNPRPAAWSFRVRGSQVHVGVGGRLRVNSYRLARSAAAAGLGIARLPTVFARQLVQEKTLVPILEGIWQRNELYAVHSAGKPTPAKIRAFIELLRAAMIRALPER